MEIAARASRFWRLAAGFLALVASLCSGTLGDTGRAAGQMPAPEPVPDVIVGPDSGAAPVRVYRATDGGVLASDFPFGAGFAGGVRVAAGDVNGDGIEDVVAAMGSGGGRVRAFSGVDMTEIVSGYPFGRDYVGGVSVAAGDVTGDGRAEVIAGQSAGGGDVRIYSADRRLLIGGAPFGGTYGGGVHVAAGDVTGDGQADVIVGQAAGGMVRVFNGADYSRLAEGFPYGETFTGGVHVAAGDVNGDGRAEVIVGPGMGDGRVQIFDALTQTDVASFVPYWAGHPGGARVAAGDLTGDGRAEIVTATGPPAPPLVRVFDGATLTSHAGLLPYDSPAVSGAFIAVRVPGRIGFTSPDQATFRVGETASFRVTTTGGSLLTALTVTGTLPAGITFTDNGRGAATLAGTADEGTIGTYALTLTATTGVAPPAAQPFILTVAAVPNAPPSFVAGPNQTVAEDSGPQAMPGWASSISPGPPREAGQTVSFVVTGNTNPSLFSVAPAVSPTGTLTYAAAENAFGIATLTVILRDDGGTVDGGQDTSPPHTLTIAITPVADLCSPGTYSNDGSRLDGAAYTIKIPSAWNGTLVVYARHYEPTKPTAADAFWRGLPEWLGGSPFTRQQDFETPLLTAGYALAGSTLRAGGWVVEDGTSDLERLRTIFRTSHCVPTHSIVVGFDMGGLIALESMEASPAGFDGGIAACAPAAGMTRTLDRLLALNLAIDATLAWPSSWGSPGDIRDDLTLTEVQSVHYLTVDDLAQSFALVPALEFIRRLVTEANAFFYDPPNPSFHTLLRYSTLVLADIERQSGGPVVQSMPYTMTANDLDIVNFLLEFSRQEPCHPDDLEVCPLPAGITAEQFLAATNATPVTPNPAARARLAATSNPTGLVSGPVITLHTTVDAPFPSSSTTAYLETMTTQGREQQLLRLFTHSRGGHCEFLPDHLIGAVAGMRSWLETGVRPSASDETLFPTRIGFAHGFTPRGWRF